MAKWLSATITLKTIYLTSWKLRQMKRNVHTLPAQDLPVTPSFIVSLIESLSCKTIHKVKREENNLLIYKEWSRVIEKLWAARSQWRHLPTNRIFILSSLAYYFPWGVVETCVLKKNTPTLLFQIIKQV